MHPFDLSHLVHYFLFLCHLFSQAQLVLEDGQNTGLRMKKTESIFTPIKCVSEE